jgi:hypothetical protein
VAEQSASWDTPPPFLAPDRIFPPKSLVTLTQRVINKDSYRDLITSHRGDLTRYTDAASIKDFNNHTGTKALVKMILQCYAAAITEQDINNTLFFEVIFFFNFLSPVWLTKLADPQSSSTNHNSSNYLLDLRTFRKCDPLQICHLQTQSFSDLQIHTLPSLQI